MNKEAVTLQEMENALLNKFMEKYDNPQKTKEIYEACFGKGESMITEEIMNAFDSLFKEAKQPPIKPELRAHLQSVVEDIFKENIYVGTSQEVFTQVFAEVLERSFNGMLKQMKEERA